MQTTISRSRRNMPENYNITLNFLDNANKQADDLFYSDRSAQLTYGAMQKLVIELASFITARKRPKKIGILATKSPQAYMGILAAGYVGATYIPLNLKWPEQRIVQLLEALQLDALIVDKQGLGLLTTDVLKAAPDLVVCTDKQNLQAAYNKQLIVEFSDISAETLIEPAQVDAKDLAYILFTSGTTGLPKGVMISAGSLKSYLDESRSWTNLTPQDRLAETCDVTFDLSVHNLFLCVDAGASLHIFSSLEMLAPSRFIRERSITVWMSVPTLAAMMRKSGALKADSLPSLRLSIFCGEPLPVATVEAWVQAAPNGVIENIYGPTEGTVICLRQRVDAKPAITKGRDIIAIGTPYKTMQVEIFDENQQTLDLGQAGEIALSGPQLAEGYFDYANTNQNDRFREINGQRWYLTGDLGMKDENGIFHHLGRTDNQIKLKGNRVELEEVEAHLRKAAQSEMVAVVAWPIVENSAQGLVAFCTSALTTDAIKTALLSSLPRYMVPETIHICDILPVNINGKIDRKQLLEQI
ncbi:AMP-binding protein [Paenochrobactrum sp. BZR 588]|uniref:AMP-binding protein n=1 Tax=unclassified Paenochrobactrum TaxID=2639760 RepID=UPI003852C820